MKVFEDKPRWPGAPKICLATNLLAFATRKEMRAFIDNLRANAVRKGECDACGYFHFTTPKPEPIPGKYGDGSKPWETSL